MKNLGNISDNKDIITKEYLDTKLQSKQDTVSDLSTIRSGAALGATAVQPETGKGLFSGKYSDLTGKPTIPSKLADLNERTMDLMSEPAIMSGAATLTQQPMVNLLRANRLAFLPADQVIIEQSVDGGTTWTDAQVSDVNKAKLFAGNKDAGITIPLINGVRNTNAMIRITITAMKYNVPAGTVETEKYNYWNTNYILSQERYVNMKELYFWVSSVSDRIWLSVEIAKPSSSTTWTQIYNTSNQGKYVALQGWSGNDIVSFSPQFFGGSVTQTNQSWNWRLTFRTCTTDATASGIFDNAKLSTSSTTAKQVIYAINGYGIGCWTSNPTDQMHRTDHLYNWDYNKNATFPAKVTATQFDGNLEYSKLLNAPTIPTVNDATLTIKQNGNTVGTFTANSSSDVTVNLTGGGGDTPIATKTYTGIYDSTNTAANGQLWFGTIKPNTFSNTWKLKFHLSVSVPNQPTYSGEYDYIIWGSGAGRGGYYTANQFYYSGVYPIYQNLSWHAKTTAVASATGHLIGTQFNSATNITSVNYKRDVKIDLMSCDGGTFTFFDSYTKSADAVTASDYGTIQTISTTVQGVRLSGDQNDPNHSSRYAYGRWKTTDAIYRYMVCLTNGGQLIPINTNSNVTGNKSSGFTVREFDPLGDIMWYNTTTTLSANTVYSGSNFYTKYGSLVDLRYAFNGLSSTASSSKLAANDSAYLVARPTDNGKAKLYYGANNTTYDACLTNTLPTSEDGLIYIYLGQMYDSYRVELHQNKPIYWYSKGRVVPFTWAAYDLQTHIEEYEDIGDVSITCRDNTEYYLTNVTQLDIEFPEDPDDPDITPKFECYFHITFGYEANVTLPFSASYIGGEPQFEGETSWEMSIKNGVIVAVKY